MHIDDSVVPVLRAGQAVVFEDGYRVDGHLTLQSAPGHTPGSSVVILDSGTHKAAFVGDVLHKPRADHRAGQQQLFLHGPSSGP